MNNRLRIMSATVQYVLTESNEQGEPIREFISQPVRVFRAVHGDIWLHGDRQAFPDQAMTAEDILGRVPGELVSRT